VCWWAESLFISRSNPRWWPGTTTTSLRVFNPVSFSIALLLPFYFFDVSFD
jgi:hypothetical protein